MIDSVGLEIMSSSNPDLKWKTVKKGRRSRKPGARSLTDASKAVKFVSPKRVGDFSGSDSDKFGEGFVGQLISGKSESVPIKKRRHLLCQDSFTRHLAAPVFDDRRQHPSHPSDCEYNGAGNFSGIELLAAAASMDCDSCNGDEDLVAEGSSLNQKMSSASDAAAPREICFKSNISENFSNVIVQGGNTESSLLASDSAASFQSLCGNTECGSRPKVVNRQHWDLNTPMDAWDEPDYPVTGSKGLNDDIHVENKPNESSDSQVLNLGGDRSAEPPNLGLKENNSVIALADETGIDLCCIGSPESYYSNATVRGVHNATTKNCSDGRAPDQVLCSNSRRETQHMVLNANATQHSPSLKPCSIVVSEEKMGSTSDAIDNSQIDDCSSYFGECLRTRTTDKLHSIIQRVLMHGMATCDISQSAIELHCEYPESLKTSETTDTVIQDGKAALISDSRNQNDGFVGFSVSRLVEAELVEEHADNNLPMEESNGITVEDSSKSSSAGEHNGCVNSDGKVDSAYNARHDSDVSHGHHIHMADGDDLTALQLQEGYDSPSEDGELRRSFLYSWEENNLDNEYVDYESDGRKGDDTDVADHAVSELVEGDSEVSRTERRNLASKRFPESNGGNCGPIKHLQTRHLVKEGSANNEMAGKGSNPGSGTTVEQLIEMIKVNDTARKKRQLTDRGGALDAKMPEGDQYASGAREKHQSRIEGRSSMDTADVNDSFFTQPFRRTRSRRFNGPYPRPERDMSPNEYMGRYRPTHGERDGTQWTSFPSKRQHTSNYEVAEVRTRNRQRNDSNDSAERIGGLDYHVSRQTANYMPKGLHRSGVRSSFIENSDYVGVRRRMHPERGASNFRGRRYYLHRADRDFDDIAPLPDDIGAPTHFPRSFSRRERSFSPSSGRSAHMHVPRRRPRSRSRSQAPWAWHPQERTLGRRHPKSPDYGSEARGETLREPFQKPAFAPKYYYWDGYTSPSGRRFSPMRNYRWVEYPTFTENHFRRRRSPVRGVFRHAQRFDTVSSSGQLKSEEYYRPPQIRTGRSSDKGWKSESYNNGRRGDGSELIPRGRPSDDGGSSISRFQQKAANNFETVPTNKDDALVSDRKDASQTPGDRDWDREEEKRV